MTAEEQNKENEIREKLVKYIAELDSKKVSVVRTLIPTKILEIVGREGYDYINSVISPRNKILPIEMVYNFINKVYDPPKCVCGNYVKFNLDKRRFATYCSNKCRFENIQDIVAVRKTPSKETIEKGNEKRVQTFLKKYGETSFSKTEQYKEMVKGRTASEETKRKCKDAHLATAYSQLREKFPHCEPLFTLEEYEGVRDYKKYNWHCKNCGKDFVSSCDCGMPPVCEYCSPTGTKFEVYFKKLFESLGVEYKYRYRKLPSGKEIDLYVEDLKFGIETCGLYFHSTRNELYTKDQHISKLEECEQNGIKLFTIFDDEMYDKNKMRIVTSKVKNSLGKTKRKIHARKCKIVEIDPRTSKKFLDKYHIQGAIGSSHKYGLTYKNRIVAVMTFNKGRNGMGKKSTDGEWELGRYCTVFNFSVIGGASKLLKHFIRSVNPDKIFSYADRRWSNGNLYEKLGFQFVKNTVPNYFYTKNFTTRESRVKYQKHKLIHFPSYDISLTEEEIMKREKYHRVWDCGSKLYEWTKK